MGVGGRRGLRGWGLDRALLGVVPVGRFPSELGWTRGRGSDRGRGQKGGAGGGWGRARAGGGALGGGRTSRGRPQVSQAAAELLAFCETHAKDDPLVTPVPAAENPFRDKRLFCVLL